MSDWLSFEEVMGTTVFVRRDQVTTLHGTSERTTRLQLATGATFELPEPLDVCAAFFVGSGVQVPTLTKDEGAVSATVRPDGNDT